MHDVRISEAFAEAVAAWALEVADGRITAQTATHYEKSLLPFVSFTHAMGVEWLAELDEPTCRAWLHAPISAKSPGSRARAGQPAGDQTSRNRQVALRRAVKVWLDRGWITSDPMPAVVFPYRPGALPAPLTPIEVGRLRLHGRVGATDTFYPAVIAAALAGAAQTDLAHLVVADFDSKGCVLHVSGRGQIRDRAIALGPWAVQAFTARLATMAADAKKAQEQVATHAPLTMRKPLASYQSQSLSTSVAQNLRRAMHAARISRARVSAGSLQTYAANRCYAQTNRVEDVAALLGVKSLDAAFRYIDHDWIAEHGAAARSEQG